MPTNVDTRGSAAPAVRAIQEPNDIPIAHKGTPGYRPCMKSSAARKSSISPTPSAKLPALVPTPRKLKRSTEQPIRQKAFADCAKTPRSCQQVSLFAIHGISHGLGLAVHDPLQAYYGDKTFKKGDAFTIEPGVYVTPKLLEILPDTPKNRAFTAKVRSVVERYQNNGVRIEDALDEVACRVMRSHPSEVGP